MPLPRGRKSPHRSPSPRPLREPSRDQVMPMAWLLVWTIYCVKLAMMLAIFWATGSLEPMALVTITTWFWLGPALAIAASPAAFKVRLRKVRRRRAALIASEWSAG